jgi:hypothetical protein
MELGAVTPGDAGWLGDVMDDWDCSTRWALGGVAVSPTVVQGLLWNGVAAQRLIRTSDGEPAGLAQLAEVDLRNGVAQVALVLDPEQKQELASPVAAFVATVFRDFPVRKIMVVAPSDAAVIGACLAPLGTVVARLGDHHRRSAAEYVDVLIYEVRRTDG